MRFLACFLAVFVSFSAFAGTYNAEFIKAYDADSVTLKMEVWPDMTYEGNVRLDGIDTPELGFRGKCWAERKAAAKAREFTIGLLESAKDIEVTIDKLDKFGRPLARLYADGELLSESLIAAGYARRYRGGKREPWCDK